MRTGWQSLGVLSEHAADCHTPLDTSMGGGGLSDQGRPTHAYSGEFIESRRNSCLDDFLHSVASLVIEAIGELLDSQPRDGLTVIYSTGLYLICKSGFFL